MSPLPITVETRKNIRGRIMDHTATIGHVAAGQAHPN